MCMQEARLAECERMLVAIDLALWLNDGIAAVQAVVTCYGLLAPLIFHQIICDTVVQVCKNIIHTILIFIIISILQLKFYACVWVLIFRCLKNAC